MTVDEFVSALSKELSSYSEEITEGIKKAVDTVRFYKEDIVIAWKEFFA